MDTLTSTYGAFVLFFVAALVTVGLCASAAIKKRRVRSEQAQVVATHIAEGEETPSSWETMKRVFFGSLHWRVENQAVVATTPKGRWEENGGIANTPSLWQRRILMGERCEMPDFSGLILYDERGHALQSNNTNSAPMVQQEKRAAATVTTTLKDLLIVTRKDGNGCF